MVVTVLFDAGSATRLAFWMVSVLGAAVLIVGVATSNEGATWFGAVFGALGIAMLIISYAVDAWINRREP